MGYDHVSRRPRIRLSRYLPDTSGKAANDLLCARNEARDGIRCFLANAREVWAEFAWVFKLLKADFVVCRILCTISLAWFGILMAHFSLSTVCIV